MGTIRTSSRTRRGSRFLVICTDSMVRLEATNVIRLCASVVDVAALPPVHDLSCGCRPAMCCGAAEPGYHLWELAFLFRRFAFCLCMVAFRTNPYAQAVLSPSHFQRHFCAPISICLLVSLACPQGVALLTIAICTVAQYMMRRAPVRSPSFVYSSAQLDSVALVRH